MLQDEIDFAVAQVTGETVVEIERLGFTLADPADVEFDPEPGDRLPVVIDWDRYYTVLRVTGSSQWPGATRLRAGAGSAQ